MSCISPTSSLSLPASYPYYYFWFRNSLDIWPSLQQKYHHNLLSPSCISLLYELESPLLPPTLENNTHPCVVYQYCWGVVGRLVVYEEFVASVVLIGKSLFPLVKSFLKFSASLTYLLWSVTQSIATPRYFIFLALYNACLYGYYGTNYSLTSHGSVPMSQK